MQEVGASASAQHDASMAMANALQAAWEDLGQQLAEKQCELGRSQLDLASMQAARDLATNALQEQVGRFFQPYCRWGDLP